MGGHPICGDCLRKTKDTSKVCPSCRRAYPGKDIRNLVLEKLAENVVFDCKWGCGVSLKPAYLFLHHGECWQRQVKCIVPGCTHRTTLCEMPKHLASSSHQQDVKKHEGSRMGVRASLEGDFSTQKVHLVDMSLLMHHRVKGGMMTIAFNHFAKRLAYELTVKANKQEVIYKGLTRPFGQIVGGDIAYFPKPL